MKEKEGTFPLLIAEVANCHGGNRRYMEEMVKRLCETEVDAVKFQFIVADELVSLSHQDYRVFRNLEFGPEFWKKVVRTVRRAKKLVLFDVFGEKSLRHAISLKADMLKIHAADFDNADFLKKVLSHNRPVYLSTAGSTIKEMDWVLGMCKGRKICLLVGFQSFPTPIEESHINRIEFLRRRYRVPVGYMDHSRGTSHFSRLLPALAVSKGAVSVEKHVYLKDRKKTYDWQSAIPPEELDGLRRMMLETGKALGEKDFKRSRLEERYFETKRKCAVAKRDIKANKRLEKDDVEFLLTDKVSLSSMITRARIGSYMGKRVKKTLRKSDPVTREAFR